MNKFLKIETEGKSYEKKYGLATLTGVLILPVIYECISVEEKGGFVYADLRNEDYTHTYEVYEIKENCKLERVQESEETDFIWGMGGSDIKVMKIDGKIRVVKDLNKSLLF